MEPCALRQVALRSLYASLTKVSCAWPTFPVTVTWRRRSISENCQLPGSGVSVEFGQSICYERRRPITDNRTLCQSVLDELDFDPGVDAAQISVSVGNGVVTLSGHVGSYMQKVAFKVLFSRSRASGRSAQELEDRYPTDEETIR